MSSPARKIIPIHQEEPTLRRRFRNYVRADRDRMQKRFGRRVIGAALTGAAIGVGARVAGPRAARFFGNAASHAMSGVEKQGSRLVKGMIRSKIPFLRRKKGLGADIENAKESLAIGVVRSVGSEGAKRVALKAHRNALHLGVGAAGAHLGLGTVRDVRRTRRDQGRLARRLLLL